MISQMIYDKPLSPVHKESMGLDQLQPHTFAMAKIDHNTKVALWNRPKVWKAFSFGKHADGYDN